MISRPPAGDPSGRVNPAAETARTVHPADPLPCRRAAEAGRDGGTGDEAPSDLRACLTALARAQSTQRSEPWHQSSLVTVVWVATVCAVVGVAAVQWWKGQADLESARLDARSFEQTVRELTRTRPAVTLAQLDDFQFLREHGAPTRFYLPQEFSGYTLSSVEVIHLGDAQVPVAVRRYVRNADSLENTLVPAPDAFRVYTVSRERLDEKSLLTEAAAITPRTGGSPADDNAGSAAQFVIDCSSLSVLVPEGDGPDDTQLASF